MPQLSSATILALSLGSHIVCPCCRYVVKEMLGQGTFGQVVRCTLQDTQENLAVKVIKNQTAFYHQVSSSVLD